jgi:hypothetical protein
MKNIDPVSHFLTQIEEGGARLKHGEEHAGITTDMPGRWTINAFDTDKHNKDETPRLKENEDAEYQPFLGMQDEKTAKVCAWCDADKKMTHEFKRKNITVTGGICKKHAKEMATQSQSLMGKTSLKELAFPNNAGIMEIGKFYMECSDDTLMAKYEELVTISQNESIPQLQRDKAEADAWKIIQDFNNVVFQGDGPWRPDFRHRERVELEKTMLNQEV